MGFLFGGSTGSTNASAQKRAAGIRVQTSIYGTPIALAFGRVRLAPNLIWYGDFQAVHQESESGGKGGAPDAGGGGQWNYKASLQLALCAGPIAAVVRVWESKGRKLITSTDFVVHLGTYPQDPWTHLVSNHPDDALPYPGVAHCDYVSYRLGNSDILPNFNFELDGLCQLAGGQDCDPAEVVEFLLTDSKEGAGFPSARLASLQAYSDYCLAAGLIIAPTYSEQVEASQILSDIIDLTNSQFYTSEGELKIRPLGDEDLANDGGSYTAPTEPDAEIGVDDILYADGEDPIRIRRKRPADAYNQVSLEFVNRSNDYNEEPATVKNQQAIDAYGLRPEESVDGRIFANANAAYMASGLRLARQKVLNEYEFILGWKWICLDPTDIISVTEPNTGLVDQWMRVREISEDEDGRLTVLCDEYVQGAGSARVYPYEIPEGYVPSRYNDPGNVSTPLIFEPPVELTGDKELWVAVSGGGDWGGCEVWVSTDDAHYKRMATIEAPARYGVLRSTFPTGSDPDTDNEIEIDLSISNGDLDGGTQADADAEATLCWVGGEICSYQSATVVANHQYDLGTYIRRGLYGTTIASHAGGSGFAMLDDRIAKIPFKNKLASAQTLYIKFVSFNLFKKQKQAIDDITAYEYGNAVSLASMAGYAPTVAASSKGIDVDWASWAEPPDIKQYRIYCDTSNPPTTLKAKCGGSHKRLNIKVKPGQVYYVRIFPVGKFGQGTGSSIVGTDGSVRDLQEQIGTIVGAFRETFDSRDILATWDDNDSDPTVTYTQSGVAGGVALQSEDLVWRVSPTAIPFDRTKLYRMRGRIRKTAGTQGTTAYIGLVGVAADGVTLVNIYGSDSLDWQHYVCIANANPGVSNEWSEYTGYFKGAASGDGTHWSSPDAASPGQLHADCRYFRPAFILNYGLLGNDVSVSWPNGDEILWPDETTVDWDEPASGDTWEIDEINIDILPDWYDIRGDGRPADYADVTISQLSVRGPNHIQARYASFEGRNLPPLDAYQCTTALDPTIGDLGSKSLKVTNSAQNGWVYLSSRYSNFNTRLSALKRWIIGGRVRSNIPSAVVRMFVYGSDGGHYYMSSGVAWTLGAAGEFHDMYGLIDLTASSAKRFVAGIESLNAANTITWWDGLILKEYVGDGTTIEPGVFEPGALGIEGIGTDMIEDDGASLEQQVEVVEYDLVSYSVTYEIAATSAILLYPKDKIRISANVESVEFRTQLWLQEKIGDGSWTTKRGCRITDASQGGTVHFQRRALTQNTYQYRLLADTIATANNNLVEGISIDVIQVKK